MGTINDKINYLNETKQAFKNSLQNKGIEVADTDTFRSYVEKIDGMEVGEMGAICIIDQSILKSGENIRSSIVEIKNINTTGIKSFVAMFSSLPGITTIPKIDTSGADTMERAFYGCSSLITIPKIDASKVENVKNIFASCPSLGNIEGLENLGKGYRGMTSNNSNFTLDVSGSSKLIHESLMNIINNLYDLNLTYNVANGGTLYTQKLQLGATNIAKLTSEEINIATLKGWNLS